jgi:hypothetical protein
MSLSSHAGDGAAEVMLVVVHCRYRVMLEMVLPNQHWSWCNVTADDHANVICGLICI